MRVVEEDFNCEDTEQKVANDRWNRRESVHIVERSPLVQFESEEEAWENNQVITKDNLDQIQKIRLRNLELNQLVKEL